MSNVLCFSCFKFWKIFEFRTIELFALALHQEVRNSVLKVRNRTRMRTDVKTDAKNMEKHSSSMFICFSSMHSLLTLTLQKLGRNPKPIGNLANTQNATTCLLLGLRGCDWRVFPFTSSPRVFGRAVWPGAFCFFRTNNFVAEKKRLVEFVLCIKKNSDSFLHFVLLTLKVRVVSLAIHTYSTSPTK